MSPDERKRPQDLVIPVAPATPDAQGSGEEEKPVTLNDDTGRADAVTMTDGRK